MISCNFIFSCSTIRKTKKKYRAAKTSTTTFATGNSNKAQCQHHAKEWLVWSCLGSLGGTQLAFSCVFRHFQHDDNNPHIQLTLSANLLLTSEKEVFCNTFLLKQGTSKASKGKISTLEFPELLAHVQNPTDSEGAAASYPYWIKPLLYILV